MGVAPNEDELIDPPESVDPPNEDEVVDPPAGDPTDPPVGDEDEDEEVVVQIGNEEPPASEEKQEAPAWVKDLRRRQREVIEENKRLKAQLATGANAQAQGKPELPPKPKLADYDYDEEKYEQARDAWDAKKREVDAWDAAQEQRVKAAQQAVAAVHENYAKSKQALKVRDFGEAEDEVTSQFSQVQQSIVIAGAQNPAAMVYALGKNPTKLRELASIKDPVKFAVAVGKLETEVKVTTKRTSTKPAPESTVRSGSGSASTTSATLERLEAEAERTGDRSKVIAYKRSQRQQAK